MAKKLYSPDKEYKAGIGIFNDAVFSNELLSDIVITMFVEVYPSLTKHVVVLNYSLTDIFGTTPPVIGIKFGIYASISSISAFASMFSFRQLICFELIRLLPSG